MHLRSKKVIKSAEQVLARAEATLKELEKDNPAEETAKGEKVAAGQEKSTPQATPAAAKKPAATGTAGSDGPDHDHGDHKH